jgi:hypothetical protein
MPLSVARIRHSLQTFDFKSLFVQELGWEKHSGTLPITADGKTFSLQALAEKRGMQVFECPAPAADAFPDYALRRKIERQTAKLAHEHLIIFTDPARTVQTWQWVRREPGRPLACREHTFQKGQPGDSLIQKLQYLAFDLEEEERLGGIVEVTGRARQAFDVERVTKRFYDCFQQEHAAFLKFIKGITAEGDREWYASLMLNRLMFVYFIQKKGFLNDDTDYLRNRLKMLQERRGKDKFLTFYRYFLRRFFHEGLGRPDRTPELEELLGNVPYVNGGLFEEHKLEEDNPDIHIPDQPFERLFAFFHEYHWHLDDRPLRSDRDINPDVLGYIFEKYINQKQMGAYYTKEDITGYIARNTIIPFLFDAADRKCSIAFRPDSAVWRLLRDDPDRYIYAAFRKGVDLPLPPTVAQGLDDVSKRRGWNGPASPEYGLPTETWREHVARRQRCQELRAKLKAGEIHTISDLITGNLDICQFAEDVIENCEGPELLRAFYRTLAGHIPEKSNEKHEAGLSILDPTCGSGAFLFAALNILEPLYEACLGRMQAFLEDLERSGEKHHPEKFADFRKVLSEANDPARHPNHRYFVLKSIILTNLYGVDIMEEAVEICKLRLFLKLVAQVEKVKHLEPLPDIDFNIRAGNTLVGFASLDDVKKTLEGTLGFGKKEVDRIVEDAEVVDRAFEKFREMQTRHGMDAKKFSQDKVNLRKRLDKLRVELDRYLALDYSVDPSSSKVFQGWHDSHLPFHWCAEFYGIMSKGGFDVIIGNPPYVEYKDIQRSYTVRRFVTLPCGDLYAYVLERVYAVSRGSARLGLIIPVSIFGTDGFAILQELSLRSMGSLWVSSFANRPSQLFDGAQKRLTILIGVREADAQPAIYTTAYLRWKRDERDALFPTRISYATRGSAFNVFPASLEKLGSDLEVAAFGRLCCRGSALADGVQDTSEHVVYYTRKFGYFLAFLDAPPRMREIKTGKSRLPSELKTLACASRRSMYCAIGALSSSTFFWFWNVLSDCRNLNRRDILAFPLALDGLPPALATRLSHLGSSYLDMLHRKSRTMIKSGLEIETFDYASCKAALDDIDHELAKHYGFTDEELDFIINYDIKYRLGQDAEGEPEE